MKKLMALILLISSIGAFSQSAQFGLKGGLNFGSTGDITTLDNENFDGDNRIGFHAGLYAKFKFLGIFLQPEVGYTRLTTEYNQGGSNTDYNFSKLDIPVLVGIDVVGPLSIKAGPAFQLVLDNDLDLNGFDANEPENRFTVGYQIGAGVQFGRLGFDLRYESAFTENDTSITSDISDIAQTQFSIDSRPSQWILSVSYQLKGNGG